MRVEWRADAKLVRANGMFRLSASLARSSPTRSRGTRFVWKEIPETIRVVEESEDLTQRSRS